MSRSSPAIYCRRLDFGAEISVSIVAYNVTF
jgi:hypothetical protein